MKKNEKKSKDTVSKLFKIARSMDEEKAFKLVDSIFKPHEYGRYSTIPLFDCFESKKNYEEIQKLILTFIRKDLLSHIDDFDIIISVDFKATTILRSVKPIIPELKNKDIIKSSYAFELDYKEQSVCIIDDAIKRGEHVRKFIKHALDKGARKVHIYALAAIDSTIKHMEKEYKKYGKEIKFFHRMHLESERQFGDQYGTKICSYMNFTFIPSDKDHFYCKCKVIPLINKFGFLKLASSLNQPYFVVPTGGKTQKKLKISIQYEDLDIHNKLPPVFKTRKEMLYKMRMFVHADMGIMYLVPIVMDLDLGGWSERPCDDLFCFQRNMRSEYPTKDNKNKFQGNKGEKSDKKNICIECFHFYCKKVFLEYFLKKLDNALLDFVFEKNDVEVRIRDIGWDEIEKKYLVDKEWEKIVEECTEGLKTISVDKSFTERDHRHV